MNNFKKIIELIKEAFQIAINNGINNLLQPGLVKEMIIAEILNHKLITTKKGADACDKMIKINYVNISVAKKVGQVNLIGCLNLLLKKEKNPY